MVVVCTGWLTKRGHVRKNWKRRYFVLESNGFLKYYGSNVDSAAKNLIDLRTVSVITTGRNVSLRASFLTLVFMIYFYPTRLCLGICMCALFHDDLVDVFPPFDHWNQLSEWPAGAAPNCRLALITKKRTLFFYSETDADCTTWLSALNKVAAEVCNVSACRLTCLPSPL
jgi:hypothetical protein